jgi:hypothetical protein
MTMHEPLTPYGSLAALNRHLQSLYEADWEDPRGAIRFSAALKLDELSRAGIFHNARIFLNALIKEGSTPTTATGNLTRAFVGELFNRWRLSPVQVKSIRAVCKIINELDIPQLHEVRLLAQYGKLTAKRNKRLTVAKLGREFLADERSGELFRRLFLTYFRTMDLSYLVNAREEPDIQSTLAITLWRLEQVAENWRVVKGIAGQIFPPRLTAHLISKQQGAFDSPDYFAAAYVLQPLREFGLLEPRQESEWHIAEKDTVRVTPLFRRFINFAEIPSVINN